MEQVFLGFLPVSEVPAQFGFVTAPGLQLVLSLAERKVFSSDWPQETEELGILGTWREQLGEGQVKEEPIRKWPKVDLKEGAYFLRGWKEQTLKFPFQNELWGRHWPLAWVPWPLEKCCCQVRCWVPERELVLSVSQSVPTQGNGLGSPRCCVDVNGNRAALGDRLGRIFIYALK